MKKRYTKKQILEAIKYWERRLEAGNYRKVDESVEYEGAVEDITAELKGRNDVPNYLKEYIKEQVLQDVGHDGVGYHDWDLQGWADDLLEDRVVEVEDMIWNDGDDDDGTVTPIPNDQLPLKFSPYAVERILRRMFPDRKGLFPACISIKFPEHGLSYYWANQCFDDPQWRAEVSKDGTIPLEFSYDSGDASEIGRPGPTAF